MNVTLRKPVAMTSPIVVELRPTLESVSRDTFADGLTELYPAGRGPEDTVLRTRRNGRATVPTTEVTCSASRTSTAGGTLHPPLIQDATAVATAR
jgi:hypothetical protein